MAKLLQGNTALLQPVNILPNSDFSRGGGYSGANNLKGTLLANQEKYFSQGWKFKAVNGNIFNLYYNQLGGGGSHIHFYCRFTRNLSLYNK